MLGYTFGILVFICRLSWLFLGIFIMEYSSFEYFLLVEKLFLRSF